MALVQFVQRRLMTRLSTLHHICHEAQEAVVVVRRLVATGVRKHLWGKDMLVSLIVVSRRTGTCLCLFLQLARWSPGIVHL